MLKGEREREIINILKLEGGFVTVKDLCKKLYASESSIRRDLVSLSNKGIISRTHGGAELVKRFSNVVSFNNRFSHNSDEKRIIARKAKSLISDGDIIFIDQSSTSFYLANELINNSTLTVVTNSIEVISLLSDSSVKVISSGGTLSNENRACLIGSSAYNTFDNIYADLVFFSSKALSADGIISDCTQEEIFVRGAMLKNARKKVFLCDSEKYGTQAPYKQISLKDIDYVVSEKDLSSHFPEYTSVKFL